MNPNLKPDYDQTKKSARFDIALIEIQEPFQFKKSIHPICLPDEVIDKDEHTDAGYTLLGFGQNILSGVH